MKPSTEDIISKIKIAEYYLLKWKGEDWLKEKVTTVLQNASYQKMN